MNELPSTSPEAEAVITIARTLFEVSGTKPSQRRKTGEKFGKTLYHRIQEQGGMDRSEFLQIIRAAEDIGIPPNAILYGYRRAALS